MSSVRSMELPQAWQAVLEDHHFQKTARGYERDGIHFCPDGRWLGFASISSSYSNRPLTGALDQRGLWTRIHGSDGKRTVFDLPVLAITPDLADEIHEGVEDTSLGAYLRWVLASHSGLLPEGWHPPDRSCVESWVPSGSMTVQTGPLVRQGEVVLTEDRWALRFPVVVSLPLQLPPAREWALLNLIRAASGQWRMIRLGLENRGDETRALVAEVDLSGAPHCQTLFLAGLDGLRHVVLWLAETADLLADVSVTVRSLDHRRPQNPNERKEP